MHTSPQDHPSDPLASLGAVAVTATPVPPPIDAEGTPARPVPPTPEIAEATPGVSPASPSLPSSPTSPRRRGRRPAGADTRAQILASARRLFSTRGYDAVSLRSIARDADVDPALVHHYFEGKPAVFAASMLTPAYRPGQHLAQITSAPTEQVGQVILRGFLEVWDTPGQQGAMLAVLANAVSPEAGIRPYREFMITEVLGKIPPRKGDDSFDDRRAQLIASQVLGVALSRYVLRLPEMASASIDELTTWVGPTLQHYFEGDLG